MKTPNIRFFSPGENTVIVKESVKAKSAASGYISTSGKIVLPVSTLRKLGINAASASFMIGSPARQKTIKSIFLVPASEKDGAFSFQKSAGGGYAIPLAAILKKGGVDFESAKVPFLVTEFDYSQGITGYELRLQEVRPKPAYTGKPRGRKPKQALAEAS
ncbi:hypothetical protein [Dyadobacter sp. 22481]|uniref:hypothetical protein n=1 Tax=Dyadobacter sp. 22481 TaxID=3453926 RepID=UPI003F87FCF0